MEMEVIDQGNDLQKKKVKEGKELLMDENEEEAEVAGYSTLMRPQEDVYAEAFCTDKKAETEVKREGNIQVYKMVCVILSIICLVLLLAVIVLCTKLPAGSPDCPEKESKSLLSTCSKQSCKALYNIPSKETPHCDEDWPSFDGSCYFLSTSRKSWSESQRFCISLGGSLAVIKSPSVQDFLNKRGSLMYWIGLSQSNGTWTWVDNTALQKRYWAEEPAQGDCVYLKTAGDAEKNWIRERCQLHTYFICQMQMK